MWTCPKCKAAHDFGHHPDHWADGSKRFELECQCGTTFEVDVDWSPHFRVDPSSVREKADV
jgi:hypothetical protein